MQLLLSHPYFWPHVLRGAEREVHDVGTGLAARGHDVRLVTGQPGGLTTTSRYEGLRVRYVRTWLPELAAARGVTRELAFGPVAGAAALASRAEAVLSYHYPDAYAVACADRLARRRRPRVLKLTGSVPRWYQERHGSRADQAVLRRALDGADEVWVNSPYVVEAMADWGVDLRVLPAGLDVTAFRPCAPRAEQPTVLCTAAPSDPRKRVVDLLDAWPGIVSQLPGARLVLAQEVGTDLRRALLARVPEPVRASVELVGPLSGTRLAEAYSSAWVVVAPAVHEALGLATIEALACGTPVAGARSGATPWLLDREGTGALFEPGDPDALAAAVLSAAATRDDPRALAGRRSSAERFAWPGILDRVERRLEALRR